MLNDECRKNDECRNPNDKKNDNPCKLSMRSKSAVRIRPPPWRKGRALRQTHTKMRMVSPNPPGTRNPSCVPRSPMPKRDVAHCDVRLGMIYSSDHEEASGLADAVLAVCHRSLTLLRILRLHSSGTLLSRATGEPLGTSHPAVERRCLRHACGTWTGCSRDS